MKKSRSFLFNQAQYEGFKGVCRRSGITVTEAFERFMACCIEQDRLVYVEHAAAGFEVEARVLVDWLCKGRYFYRDTAGAELNVSGRLLYLLPHVGPELALQIEAALKASVQTKEA